MYLALVFLAAISALCVISFRVNDILYFFAVVHFVERIMQNGLL